MTLDRSLSLERTSIMNVKQMLLRYSTDFNSDTTDDPSVRRYAIVKAMLPIKKISDVAAHASITCALE